MKWKEKRNLFYEPIDDIVHISAIQEEYQENQFINTILFPNNALHKQNIVITVGKIYVICFVYKRIFDCQY